MAAFDAELNDAQADAVAHVNGPLLVFAGAGSGKTRVITYRIANLVACASVPPYRIFAVTFTNKAAGEMRARVGSLLGHDVGRDVWVGTFHATCAKLLRLHGAAMGIPRNFSIYDGADQKSLVTRALRDLDLDDKRYPPKAVLGRIHKEKQEGRGPDDMSLDSYMDDAIQRIYRRYEEALRAANAVDFEDLILLTVRLLEEDPQGEGERLRRRFEYVLVDEFQDTNATQYRFLRALVKHHQNLCVVGDDDQSIYRWRGADIRNIRNFRKDFAGATVVKLEQNYRSTANIVRAALGVIERSASREPKDLWTENGAGAPIDLVSCADERDEAGYVVRVIQDARAAGVDPRHISVFYRIHAQSRVLEEAMRSVNIPYQIVGGMKFYERAEVKDALSYLRVLANPRSDVDFLRIVNTPARGIGQTTVERLAALARSRELSITDALRRLDDPEEARDIATAARKKLVALRDLLDELRSDATRATPSSLLRAVLETTGYSEALRKDDSAEGDARLENLEELYGSLQDYEAETHAAGEAATLEGFLERVSLQSDVDGMKDAPRVTLMTVHGAKGLEFELVLLTGMEEEMFPYRGMEPGGEEEMEEERRLAYVAITRARQKLVMTHVAVRQIFGTSRYGRPSRFFRDVPQDIFAKKATRAAEGRVGFLARGSSDRSGTSVYGGAWSHPQARDAGRPTGAAGRGLGTTPPPVAAGERYVDREYFADEPGQAGDEAPLRRGSRVGHTRFGEGEVRRVEGGATPSAVVFFPGWGEKKILLQYLRPA